MPQPARQALCEREAEGRDSYHDFGAELRHLRGKHVGDRVEYAEAGLIGDQGRDRPRAVSRQHPDRKEQMAAVGQPRRVAGRVPYSYDSPRDPLVPHYGGGQQLVGDAADA